MTREIKFKTYSKLGKIPEYCTLQEIIDKKTFDFAFENYIFCEWTGLKDKNGKEIYQGDICSGHSDGNGVIKWSKFDGGYNYEFGDENVVGIWEVLNDIRIIGNIYENPELLK